MHVHNVYSDGRRDMEHAITTLLLFVAWSTRSSFPRSQTHDLCEIQKPKTPIHESRPTTSLCGET